MNSCSCPSLYRPRSAAAELYGWECKEQFWYGPTQLEAARSRRITALDPSWAVCSWRKSSRSADALALTLSTTVRDLRDCAVATVDVNRLCAGPAAIVVAVSEHRLGSLRPDFAFELTAFARFLEGPNAAGSELMIHDHIERIIADARRRAVVFAFCSFCCSGDSGITVSTYIEQLAGGLIDWVRLRDSKPDRADSSPRIVRLHSRSAP